MQLSNSFTNRSSQLALWLAQNPHVARAILLALPVILALGVALLTGAPAYACSPSANGGGTTCG